MESKQLKWIYLVGLALIWEFIYFIKKGIDWIISSTGWLFTDYLAVFLLLIGFRSLSKIPKEKWKFIAMTSMFGTLFRLFFRYSAN
jgi:hypothetical protein